MGNLFRELRKLLNTFQNKLFSEITEFTYFLRFFCFRLATNEFPVDLITFTEEILNRKLHLLCNYVL